MHSVDLALLLLRVTLAIVFIAHGWNHVFGGGKIAGTSRWFESLGMRPGILHAWIASLTELGAGVLLLIGFLTPLAAAGVVGTMVVAWITNHRKNGFFIFRPGEGYEYVMVLTLVAASLGALGAGRWSLDCLIGWFSPPGWSGWLIVAVIGFGGGLLTLVGFWRPERPEPASTSD